MWTVPKFITQDTQGILVIIILNHELHTTVNNLALQAAVARKCVNLAQMPKWNPRFKPETSSDGNSWSWFAAMHKMFHPQLVHKWLHNLNKHFNKH